MRSQASSTCGRLLLTLAVTLTGCAAPQTASPTLSLSPPTSAPVTTTIQKTATSIPQLPTPTTTPLIATNQMTEVSPVLLYDEWPREGFPSDPAQVTVMDLENNILKLKVIYFGGCRVHTFELHAFTGFAASDPPQGMMQLSHDAHGDRCTMQIARFLKFDLTPRDKGRNNRGEHPLHLWLSEPIGGGFAVDPLRPRIEWP